MSFIKYLIVFIFAQILKPYWLEIMIVMIVTAVIVIGCMVLRYIEENKKDMEKGQNGAPENTNEEQNTLNEAQNAPNQEPDTLGLMFTTLSNLGCQPTKNDDGSLTVAYQGEHFHMEFGGRYARIWDPMWASIKANDPNLPKVREAVNTANFSFGPTVVLSDPDDNGDINFLSRRDIMLHPACPDNEPFVDAVLNSFFKIKEEVRRNYQQINAAQTEAQRTRRPVGFTTENQE